MEKNNETRQAELKAIIIKNHVSPIEVEDAITQHLIQLQRLGATLEDNICEILRKVLAQVKAREELYDITSDPKYL